MDLSTGSFRAEIKREMQAIAVSGRVATSVRNASNTSGVKSYTYVQNDAAIYRLNPVRARTGAEVDFTGDSRRSNLRGIPPPKS
jgi:hypothetical protein